MYQVTNANAIGRCQVLLSSWLPSASNVLGRSGGKLGVTKSVCRTGFSTFTIRRRLGLVKDEEGRDVDNCDLQIL